MCVGTGEDLPIWELAELVRKVVCYGGRIVFDRGNPDGTPRRLLSVWRLTSLM